MMNQKTRKALLCLGLDTELINKIEEKSLTLSGLRGLNREALIANGFSAEEAALIIRKANRQPIPNTTLESLIKKCGGICCYCADGNSARPFQVHHMEEYSVSQNNNEENLMLVCPTHHVNIHSKKISTDDQKAQKRVWQNLWEIAEKYSEKNINFPFGAFEYIDYKVKGNITDIFSFGPPAPCVCVELSDGHILNNAVVALDKNNCIILSGNSGSGKTTFSLALAGKIRNYEVFRYVVSDGSSIANCQEILRFLSLANRKLVLIIDDANIRLAADQIAEIIKAAGHEQKIIFINTRATLSSQQDFEQHHLCLVFPIQWQAIRESVKINLLKHEREIVTYLTDKGLNAFMSRTIGLATFDVKLSEVIDFYLAETDSVWQFIFMMASGIDQLDKMHVELVNKERLDLIVLLIGINQIARVEKGTSKEDIKELFSSHSKLKQEALPSDDWLEKVFNDLVKSRKIKPRRDRYNLAHRKFAQNFIGHSYFKCKADTIELLDRIFLTRKSINELLILWSWIRDSNAKEYVSQWQQSLSKNDWKEIGDLAAKENLFCLYLLCDILHPGNKQTLYEILNDKADIIAGYINRPAEYTLYYFCRMAAPIKYACPELWNELLPKIDQPAFAKLIKTSDPWMFNDLDWLFNTIAAFSKQWLIKLSLLFEQSDFNAIIAKIDKGDVKMLSEIIDFQRKYISNIRKSDLAYYAGQISRLLKDCSIEQIRFPALYHGIFDLFGYPDLIDTIMSNLDAVALAKEFVTLPPRCWENLVFLSFLGEKGNSHKIADFLDNININDLIKNIEKYYLDNPFEIQAMLDQLSFAKKKRKKEFGHALYYFVKKAMEKILQSGYNTGYRVLQSYADIDSQLAQKICGELKIDAETALKVDDKDSIDYSEYLIDIEKNEASGQDYLIYQYKIE